MIFLKKVAIAIGLLFFVAVWVGFLVGEMGAEEMKVVASQN